MAGELVERLRASIVVTSEGNGLRMSLSADDVEAAADELTALTTDRDAARKVYLTLQQSNAVLAAKVALLTEALKGLDAPWIQFINCWADPSGDAAYDAKEEEGNVKVLADAMTAARAALGPKP